ncbi:MAG: AGE family epimerase/isomerase [Asticcacaulis sp.]|uniref:AGE family epimerase/isomerase n=1 Tax=Asticcacaulis sp. TaxID=1872648 RepID=UPI003F7C7934
MKPALDIFRQEARAEADAILRWWSENAPDPSGGFYGEIDASGQPVPGAPKAAILNARMLWFFAAAGGTASAQRAADYLKAHLLDKEHGGVFWTVDAQGRPRDTKKQAYAQAFALYGFAEHYAATDDPAALATARAMRDLIETRFWDADRGGYIEALTRDWAAVNDPRLSDKDMDAPKTMNTHLHVLEAYTRLHQVAPDAATQVALRRAIEVFIDRFMGSDGHLRLFFDMDWTDRTEAISYGHDIEASWLLWEAVETLDDPALIARARPHVLALARATLEQGVLDHGGIAYERGFDGRLDADGEWWGQAEGLVGFVNAFQMTSEKAYADAALRLWARIKSGYGAAQGREWTWYARDAKRPPQALLSLWKCPYHNGRAMLELVKRLG